MDKRVYLLQNICLQTTADWSIPAEKVMSESDSIGRFQRTRALTRKYRTRKVKICIKIKKKKLTPIGTAFLSSDCHNIQDF